MKISITVKAGSKVEGISESGGVLSVKVKEPAREGKANKAVIRLLAAYYRVPQSNIRITGGLSSKHKTVELPDGI